MRGRVALAILLASLALTGCPSGGSTMTSTSTAQVDSYSHKALMNSASAGIMQETVDVYNDEVSIPETSPKLIRTVQLSVRIDSGENLATTIDSLISEVASLGGYVSNNNVDYSKEYAGATLLLRIPKDNVDEFLTAAKEITPDVRNLVDNYEDVTDSYIDTESRLAVRETARDKYMSYLERADSIEEVLQIEDRLNECIEDIESAKSKLQYYDSRINYCEVTVRISCATSGDRESFGTKFKEALREMFYDAGDTFIRGAGWFINAVISLVFFLPIAVLCIRVFLFAIGKGKKISIKRFMKRSKEVPENKD